MHIKQFITLVAGIGIGSLITHQLTSPKSIDSQSIMTKTGSQYNTTKYPNSNFKQNKLRHLKDKASLDTYLNKPNLQRNYEEFESLFNSLKQYSTAEIFTLLTNSEYSIDNGRLSMLRDLATSILIEREPRQTMDFLLENSKISKNGVLVNSLHDWISSSPDEAYEWFLNNKKKLPGDALYGKTEAQYALKKSLDNFSSGLEVAVKFKTSEDSAFKALIEKQDNDAKASSSDYGRKTITSYSEIYNASSEEQRKEILQSLEGDEFTQQMVVGNYIKHIMDASPEFVLKEISKMTEDQPEYELRLKELYFSNYAADYPQKAMNLALNEFNDKPNAGELISETYTQWVNKDVKAALNWLNDNIETYGNDRLFNSSGDRLVSKGDYSQATEFYLHMNDKELQTEALNSLYYLYSSEDSHAANLWKEQLPKPFQEKLSQQNDEF